MGMKLSQDWRRIAPADQDDVHPFRQDRDSAQDDFMKRRVRRDPVIIVKDYEERGLQSSIKVFKQSKGECRNSRQVFGGQKGKGPLKAGRCLFCSKP